MGRILYYRLKTVTINVPALRNRVEDIGPLVERFALEFTRSNDFLYRGFMPEAVRVLKQYEWPGNVRELKNFVEKIINSPPKLKSFIQTQNIVC